MYITWVVLAKKSEEDLSDTQVTTPTLPANLSTPYSKLFLKRPPIKGKMWSVSAQNNANRYFF